MTTKRTKKSALVGRGEGRCGGVRKYDGGGGGMGRDVKQKGSNETKNKKA